MPKYKGRDPEVKLTPPDPLTMAGVKYKNMFNRDSTHLFTQLSEPL